MIRKLNPVKPARKAKRRAKQITAPSVEQRRYTKTLRQMGKSPLQWPTPMFPVGLDKARDAK